MTESKTDPGFLQAGDQLPFYTQAAYPIKQQPDLDAFLGLFLQKGKELA
ncbi:Uncharacterised protein [Mycobacteroides abscessus subsp. abscessus]|nr:Uncharacterised protein [Mycobacteroides abscessus subsp. abscessus]